MTTRSLLLSFAATLSVATASERLWTSSDGEHTMQAQFISAEGETATINRNGHVLTFKISRLSEADQAWIKKLSAPLEPLTEILAEDFAASPFGKALVKTKIRKGDSFTDHPISPVPKLFFLYYSASW